MVKLPLLLLLFLNQQLTFPVPTLMFLMERLVTSVVVELPTQPYLHQLKILLQLEEYEWVLTSFQIHLVILIPLIHL